MDSSTRFEWNKEKNQKLLVERGICFEDVLKAIDNKNVLDTIDHANHNKYPNQYILIIDINNYAYAVPFVLNKDKIFLKTIFPSRKYTKQYVN